MKLKEAIKELGLAPDTPVFLYIYDKTDSDTCTDVEDIDKKTLNKAVKVIHPHVGGQKYGYNCYRFILEK